jgi:hypothetical protein
MDIDKLLKALEFYFMLEGDTYEAAWCSYLRESKMPDRRKQIIIMDWWGNEPFIKRKRPKPSPSR